MEGGERWREDLDAVKAALRSAEEGRDPWVVGHIDLTCDACEAEPIVGCRWKCEVCDDRDLCGECYVALDAARDKADTLPESVKDAVPCLQHAFQRVEGPERQVVLRGGYDAAEEGGGELAEASTAPRGALTSYLETFRVARIPCSVLAWVVVELTPVTVAEAVLSAAIEEWEALVERKRPSAVDVDELARRHNLVEGKWCLFPDRSCVDTVWAAVARALPSIPGVSGAKVSTFAPEKDSQVVCVYTNNYLDFAQVEAVRASLRELMRSLQTPFTGRMVYKPDIYTYLGIYSGNEYNLRPSVYTCYGESGASGQPGARRTSHQRRER